MSTKEIEFWFELASTYRRTRRREGTLAREHGGIFGAPSFVVAQETFWGNDRMENAMRWSGDNIASRTSS
jgi:hypothetical protein